MRYSQLQSSRMSGFVPPAIIGSIAAKIRALRVAIYFLARTRLLLKARHACHRRLPPAGREPLQALARFHVNVARRTLKLAVCLPAAGWPRTLAHRRVRAAKPVRVRHAASTVRALPRRAHTPRHQCHRSPRPERGTLNTRAARVH